MFAVLLAAHLLATPASVEQSPAFDAAARVREAIEVTRRVAYKSGDVDWPAVEAEMLTLASGARDTADLLPAYQTLMVRLDDGHSFLQVPEDIEAQWEERHGDAPYLPDLPEPPDIQSAFIGRFEVTHDDLPVGAGSARLLLVPAFQGNAAGDDARAYADRLFTATASVPPGNCGYILDLRGNTGGNLWPMLLGVSALLGDSNHGVFRNADGSQAAFARIEGGKAVVLDGEDAGKVMATVPAWQNLPALAQTPVAILTDDATASSGEGVAIAFIGRPDTRSFGTRTYGVASATNGFALSDGVHLIITTALLVDANNNVHLRGIEPDVAMDASGEAPVIAAQDWLATLPGCAG